MFDFQTHTWSRMTTTGTSPANQGYVDGIALWEDTFLYAFVQPYDLPNADPLMYRLDLQKKRWGKVRHSMDQTDFQGSSKARAKGLEQGGSVTSNMLPR